MKSEIVNKRQALTIMEQWGCDFSIPRKGWREVRMRAEHETDVGLEHEAIIALGRGIFEYRTSCIADIIMS